MTVLVTRNGCCLVAYPQPAWSCCYVIHASSSSSCACTLVLISSSCWAAPQPQRALVSSLTISSGSSTRILVSSASASVPPCVSCCCCQHLCDQPSRNSVVFCDSAELVSNAFESSFSDWCARLAGAPAIVVGQSIKVFIASYEDLKYPQLT